jgi:hypothetical protein
LWNGKAGSTFEARGGGLRQAGGGRDTFFLLVKDSRGVVVLNVAGTIDNGDIQGRPRNAEARRGSGEDPPAAASARPAQAVAP